jgi:hypothetical protein
MVSDMLVRQLIVSIGIDYIKLSDTKHVKVSSFVKSFEQLLPSEVSKNNILFTIQLQLGRKGTLPWTYKRKKNHILGVLGRTNCWVAHCVIVCSVSALNTFISKQPSRHYSHTVQLQFSYRIDGRKRFLVEKKREREKTFTRTENCSAFICRESFKSYIFF